MVPLIRQNTALHTKFFKCFFSCLSYDVRAFGLQSYFANVNGELVTLVGIIDGNFYVTLILAVNNGLIYSFSKVILK